MRYNKLRMIFNAVLYILGFNQALKRFPKLIKLVFVVSAQCLPVLLARRLFSKQGNVACYFPTFENFLLKIKTCAHNIHPKIKINKAVPGCPNNKAIIAKTVPKKALSEFIVDLKSIQNLCTNIAAIIMFHKPGN